MKEHRDLAKIIFLLTAILLVAFVALRQGGNKITGLAAGTIVEHPAFVFTETSSKDIVLQGAPTSFRISGAVIGPGEGQVYLVFDGQQHLVFDSRTMQAADIRRFSNACTDTCSFAGTSEKATLLVLLNNAQLSVQDILYTTEQESSAGPAASWKNVNGEAGITRVAKHQDGKYDAEMTSLQFFVDPGTVPEVRAVVRGISSDIEGLYGSSQDNLLTTDFVAFAPLAIENAVLTLPKYGKVDAVYECKSFDLQSGSCPAWRKTTLPFTENADTITFIADHSSAYAGGNEQGQLVRVKNAKGEHIPILVERKKKLGIAAADDVTITPRTGPVKRIDIGGVGLGAEVSIGLDVPQEKGRYISLYAIDPTQTPFTTATLTATAVGDSLYKCKSWDFATQQCTDSNWVFLRQLTPGQDYTLTLTPDDPAFGEVQQPPQNGTDTYIDSYNPTTAYTNNIYLKAGRSSSSKKYRTLIFFNVSNIPPEAKITNASLSLYMHTASSPTSFTIRAHRITRSWNGSATWNKYDGVSSWTTAGGDFDGTVYDQESIGDDSGWYVWNITTLVQQWVDNSFENYGLLLKSPESVNDEDKTFKSSNFTNLPYTPILKINWTTGPTISGVDEVNITANSATIVWNTDDSSNGTLLYGLTPALGTALLNASSIINHQINLQGLSPSTTYYYNITSCNLYLMCTTVGTNNFTTASTGMVITFDTSSNTSGTGNLAFSHAIGNCSNRILIVGATAESGSSSIAADTCRATNITYGGIPLTKAGGYDFDDSGADDCASLWYLLSPPVGTATVAITLAGTVSESNAGGISICNAAQQAPENNGTNYCTGCIAISTSITTVTNGSWVVDAIGSGNQGGFTPTQGNTERWDSGASTAEGAGSTKPTAVAGPTNTSWSQAANRLVHVLAAFAPIVPDTTPPSISFISPTPANNTITGNSTVTINISITEIHPNKIQLYIDGILNDTRPYNSAANFTKILAAGTHTYYATANDTAGNNATTETRTITISTGPISILLTSPPINAIIKQATITGTANSTNPDKISTNDTRWKTNNGNYTNWTFTNTTIPDGTYSITITANNTAGNKTSTTANFTIDNTAPAVAFISPTPANNTLTGNNNITINISTTELHPDKLQLFIDGIINETVSYSGAYTNRSRSLGNGTHTYEARINDTATNNATTGVRRITIDTIGPFITNISNDDETEMCENERITVYVEDSSNVSIVLFEQDNYTNYSMTYIGNHLFELNLSALVPGEHTFLIIANDTFGNIAVSGPYLFTVTNSSISHFWQIITAEPDDEEDTYIDEDDEYGSHDNETHLRVGCEDSNCSTQHRKRAILRFNLSGIDDDEEIDGAHLILTAINVSGKRKKVEAHPVNESWKAKNASWIRRNETLNWSSYGGGYEDEKYTSEVSKPSKYGWDITHLVKQWVTHERDNDGILIKHEDEDDYDYEHYGSSHYHDDDDKPKLCIHINDTKKPRVFDLRPFFNSTFNISTLIEIAANATDQSGISVVTANITFPNGTIRKLNLTRVNGTDKYNATFLTPNLTGIYNVSFFANDTINLINASEKTKFIVVNLTQNITCGTLASNLTLTQNLTSNGTCFTIIGNNVTLNCNGFAIIDSGFGIGVNASQVNAVKITKCIIKNFESGITMTNTTNSIVINNTILQTQTSIILEDADNNTVVNNFMNTTGTGVLLEGTSANNTILSNRISGSNTSLRLQDEAGDLGPNILSNNTLTNSTVMLWVVNAFNNLINRTNFTGIAIFENGFGSTTFNSTGNFTPQANIGNVLNITFNLIFMNLTAYPPLNRSANMTLTGLSGTNRTVTVSFDQVTFQDCPEYICTRQSFDSGTLIFNVSMGGTYSSREPEGAGGNVKYAKITTGAYYAFGETIRIAAGCFDEDWHFVNATANISVIYPNGSKFFMNQSIPGLGLGVFAKNLTAPNVSGIYIATLRCRSGNKFAEDLTTFIVQPPGISANLSFNITANFTVNLTPVMQNINVTREELSRLLNRQFDFSQEEVYLITDALNSVNRITESLEKGEITPAEAETQLQKARAVIEKFKSRPTAVTKQEILQELGVTKDLLKQISSLKLTAEEQELVSQLYANVARIETLLKEDKITPFEAAQALAEIKKAMERITGGAVTKGENEPVVPVYIAVSGAAILITALMIIRGRRGNEYTK